MNNFATKVVKNYYTRKYIHQKIASKSDFSAAKHYEKEDLS